MRINGWRSITAKERANAIIKTNELPEETDEQKRDKRICKLFFEENISAQSINRLNDPLIICYSNIAKGKPLSTSSILARIYKLFPEFKGRNNVRKNNPRVELIQKRKITESPHIKQCAFCGSKSRLEEHHMIPLFMGGTNDDRNLVFLCHDCHLSVTQYQTACFRSESA